MELEKRIDQLRKEIKSDRLSMSIGELAGIYERGEIDVHPKFQRILRWSAEQKTKLIESILLRIPVPPIFVAQDTRGKWDVVDGVQRLGTILEFLGILKDASDRPREPLVLRGTKLLPELEACSFDQGSLAKSFFDIPLQLDFKRSRLDVEIILKESDPSTKYELFERLNTGGSIASDQEVRNCVLVWINEDFFDWMKDRLTEAQTFRDCVQLPDRLEAQQYRSELVLRFITFYKTDLLELKKIKDIGEFLNEQNRAIAQDRHFDRHDRERAFTETFKLLSASIGQNAFRKFNALKGSFGGPFLISAFEAVALGVAFNIDAWLAEEQPEQKIEELVKGLWGQSDFTDYIGTGVPARDRIQRSVPFGRQYFRP